VLVLLIQTEGAVLLFDTRRSQDFSITPERTSREADQMSSLITPNGSEPSQAGQRIR